MRSVDVLGLHVEATNGAPLVLLREHDEPHRVLPIFVGAPEAFAIGLALASEDPPRPLAHDLMATFLERLHAHVDHVEVTELHDGTFHAELTLHGPTGERRVDSRPSDAIALALRVHAPVFASEDVLDEAGVALLVVNGEEGGGEADPEVIDAEVARFRALLDHLDPSQLADGEPTGLDTPDDLAGPDDDRPDDEPPDRL